MSGSNKKIRPADSATREEAAVMFVKAFGIQQDANTKYLKFIDAAQISGWALESVNAMSGNGYVKGDNKNKFNPKASITRAEVAAIIDNCVKELYGKEGTYSGNIINGNVVINTPNVTLKDMQINGNIIIAEGVGNGSIYLDNVNLTGNIFVRGGGKVILNNTSVSDSLTVRSKAGQVWIVLSGTTAVKKALLESGTIIEEKDKTSGGINSVKISSGMPAGQNVSLQGVFKYVENNAANMVIEAAGTIENLLLNQKTTVKGGADIKSITTANGADSVVNGIFVAGGQTGISLKNITGKDTVSQSSPGEITYTVTFKSNGGSETAPVKVVNGNRFALPSAPTYAGYVFMGWYTDKELTNEYNVGTPVYADLTLYAKWSGYQKPVIIDERFEAGYPKFSVTSGKKIKLLVKLKTAGKDNPTEVFMLVNQMNSLFDATAEDVIHGHCGAEDGLVEADETPYIKISDNDEHEIETKVSVKGSNNIKMYFVLKDKAGKVSKEPAVIELPGTDVKLQDTVAPELYNNGVYINKAKNKVTLYFDEALNGASIPATGAFTLSDGTTASAISINSISLKNIASNKGVLELSVSGINDSSKLKISYVRPESIKLQDNAALPNSVESFSGIPVKQVNYYISPDNVAVSSQGQYIFIKTNFGLQDYNSFDFTINKGSDAGNLTPIATESDVLRIWSDSGDYHKMYICLKNIPSLSAGDKYYITLTPGLGTTAVDFAGDAVTSPISAEAAPRAVPEGSVMPEAVTYRTSLNAIAVKLPYIDDLYSDGGMFGCLFTLKVDGVSYVLRGKVYYSNGEILLNRENIPVDLAAVNWSKATLSYSSSIHNCFDSDTQLTYKSGMPFGGFTDIPVTVNP
jgi:uncharacterized repeat protein (TIGR02543 family)